MLNFKRFTTEATTEKYEDIVIEVLGIDNNWRRVEGGIQNRPQTIVRSLDNVKRRYPKSRVRAIGQTTGRFYDMLP
jgi:hypothetical protein